ncbi:MAG: GUN4 domain-containing protein [Geitlerinemataceae cyanobacterium]
MEKVALLIGISEYQNGLNPLPNALNDIKAVGKVLEDADRCAFDSVRLLPNPSRQEMEEAIYDLFSNREPEDLVLFYFSGHGINPGSSLFLATPQTRQEARGEVVPTTAVAGRYLQERMNRTASTQQVIILDCYLSGAFTQGMTSKGDGMPNLQPQLGGKGRAILTSWNSTQHASEAEGSALSIYTRYLVEGLKTGAADLDNDGTVAVDELHDYASEKVQEASPAMNPQFYPVEEGYRIYLAKSPLDDPALKYRKALQDLVREDQGDIDFRQGHIDFLNRCYLDELKQQWGLDAEVVRKIEQEVMEPLSQRQDKLKRYEEVLTKAMRQRGGDLREGDWHKLKRFQEVLELRDEDVEPIVALKSAKGADYSRLRDLLAAKKWKDADEETARVMLQVANRKEEGWLNVESINNFPSEDLRTIDRLWIRYSNNRFGFSVQKEVWEEVGGRVDSDTEKMIGDLVGWRKAGEWVNYSDLNFSLDAPRGHLPVVIWFPILGFGLISW